MTQYSKRNARALDRAGGYFARHMMAMTAENLLAKADIACELGYRDMVIDQLRPDAAPPAFSVHIGEMKTSAGTDYYVIIDRADRPADARIFDTTGRITPFMSVSRENAELEADEWAAFLGVERSDKEPT